MSKQRVLRKAEGLGLSTEGTEAVVKARIEEFFANQKQAEEVIAEVGGVAPSARQVPVLAGLFTQCKSLREGLVFLGSCIAQGMSPGPELGKLILAEFRAGELRLPLYDTDTGLVVWNTDHTLPEYDTIRYGKQIADAVMLVYGEVAVNFERRTEQFNELSSMVATACRYIYKAALGADADWAPKGVKSQFSLKKDCLASEWFDAMVENTNLDTVREFVVYASERLPGLRVVDTYATV